MPPFFYAFVTAFAAMNLRCGNASFGCRKQPQLIVVPGGRMFSNPADISTPGRGPKSLYVSAGQPAFVYKWPGLWQ